MMFETSRRARNDDERVLPLINVVFLLLIFFMLAGSLSASDPFPVTPPSSASEALAEPQEAIVLIGADGALALDGEPMELEAVETAFAARVADGSLGTVWIKGDGNADALVAITLLERLEAAGVETITLLTVPDPA